MGVWWITQFIYCIYRHETTQRGFAQSPSNEEISANENTKEDSINNYHNSRLQFGFFFFYLNDAIREGNAARLFRWFKFALSGVNYIITSTLSMPIYSCILFAKVLAVLSKEEAKRVLAYRFFNSGGKRGGNKSLDLQMEHLHPYWGTWQKNQHRG